MQDLTGFDHALVRSTFKDQIDLLFYSFSYFSYICPNELCSVMLLLLLVVVVVVIMLQ